MLRSPLMEPVAFTSEEGPGRVLRGQWPELPAGPVGGATGVGSSN